MNFISKIIAKYNALKEKNIERFYLFKSGKFYIFIGEDCERINEYVVLKKVKFSTTYKCGFPNESLDDYMRVFSNHHLDVEIVEDLSLDKIDLYDYLKKLDVNKLTPLEALNIINTLKESLDVEK